VSGRSPAEWVSYLLEPKNWIIATTLAVGWDAGGAAGLGWGAVAALFAGVLPMAFISRGVRSGRWDDRYVGAKRPRLIVLAFIIASVAVGLTLLVGLGAPHELSGYLGCMLVSVALLAAITTVWKVSIHCAVAAGSRSRRSSATVVSRIPDASTLPTTSRSGAPSKARTSTYDSMRRPISL